MIIYKITNLVNGKFYIGKDKHNNPAYMGSGLLLKKAMNKYGKENFIKEILEECFNLEELSKREIYWIEKLNAIKEGYNIATGGEGGDTYTFNPNKDLIISKLSGKKPWNNGLKLGPMSLENKEAISLSMKEKYKKIQHHSKGTEPWNKGIKTGKPSWNSGKETVKSTCPHCGKMVDKANGKRWHFENCKMK